VRTGTDTSISLKAPTPIYGSLNVIADNYIKATIFVDNKEQGSTPAFIDNVLTGSHEITLKADGYKSATKKVEVTEGKIEEVKISMQEVDKISAITAPELQIELKEKTIFDSWKSQTFDPVWIVNYRISPPTSIVGASVGYCKRFGGYVQFRTDILVDGTPLAEKDLVNEYCSGGDREYFRTSYTAGAMLRLFPFMYIYGGAGYGKYGTVYRPYYDDYYTAGLIKGIELEYGFNFKVWKISVAAGYSTIAGSDFGELHFGLGVVL
jgi:hypothetical protein